MGLPRWYLECAEDYLSVLRFSQNYSRKELLEATKKQRIAEYKLMRQKLLHENQEGEMGEGIRRVAAQVSIQAYDNSMMYKGNFGAYNGSRPVTKSFWENVLKS